MAGPYGDTSPPNVAAPERSFSTLVTPSASLPPPTPSSVQTTTRSPSLSLSKDRSTDSGATPFTPVNNDTPIDAPAKPPPAPFPAEPATDATTAAQAYPRQRSSVACLHCRRSKIRCVNTGLDTLCNSCRHANRECKYAVEIFKRSRLGNEDGDRFLKRNKARKGDILEDGPRRANTGLGAEQRDEKAYGVENGILDAALLTPQVWSELYSIFERHFGSDFPFLHPPTFAKQLRDAPDLRPRNDSSSDTRSVDESDNLPDWEIVLLGVLVLTARFHPQLVTALCSIRGKTEDLEAIEASEKYAVFLRATLVGPSGCYAGTPSLAKIQGLLMLASYEWSTCQGPKAWVHVGLATRMAQALGLQFEDDSDSQSFALASMPRLSTIHHADEYAEESRSDSMSGDSFIDEEVRRRTFWSCFMMDQYLSIGKYRPSLLVPQDLRLQLPCSQNAFLFRNRVCTEFIDGLCSGAERRMQKKARLRQNEVYSRSANSEREPLRHEQEVNVRIGCEFGHNESVLSVHVRAVETWGLITKWSCAGGLRNERHAPWNPASEFYRLNSRLSRLEGTIPQLHRLSKNNMEAHIAQQTTQPYLLLQVLLASSTMILHRELLPFVPLRSKSPQGPWSQSPFSRDMPLLYGYFVDSARQLFGATRDILELVQACQGRCAFPETPVSGFGLYLTVLMAIYAAHYPHMDFDHAVSDMLADRGAPNSIWRGLGVTLGIIGEMRTRHPMADGWFRTLRRVHHYHERIVQEAVADSRAGLSLTSLFLEHLPPHERLDEITRSFRQFSAIQDERTDEWTAPKGVTPPGWVKNENSPVATHFQRTPNRIESAHMQASGSYGPGGAYHSWSLTAERMQGSPKLNGPVHTHSEPPQHRRLSSHLVHAPSSGPSQDWSHPPASPGRYQLPPLNSALAARAEDDAAHARRTPFWMADLDRTFNAEDLAALMEGLSCKEWVESVEMASASRNGVGDEEQRGWLARIWEGSTGGS